MTPKSRLKKICRFGYISNKHYRKFKRMKKKYYEAFHYPEKIPHSL